MMRVVHKQYLYEQAGAGTPSNRVVANSRTFVKLIKVGL